VQLRSSLPSLTVAAALLAGCGGASTSSTTTFRNPAIAAQVAECEATISAEPTLSTTIKHNLEALCVKAGSGNKATVERAAAAVCAQVVGAAVAPSRRAQAIAACPKP
jgi:hypothetical protein